MIQIRKPGAVASLLVSLLVLNSAAAIADIAISANDAHSSMIDGVGGAIKDAPAGNISIIDFAQSPPKIVGSVDVPTSVLGPGQGVFVAKDESFAIVPAGNRTENDKIVPDDRVSVIDLASSPPRVLQQIRAGAGANSVAVNPAGTLALVTNRIDGNVSVFSLKDKQLTSAGTIDLGNAKSLAAGVMFAPDGKTAFVAREGGIAVLTVDGDKVEVDPKQVILALRPYPIDISPDGKLLAVSNSWGPNADIGTISLVDLSSKPYRVVDTARAPSTSEGLRFSPDGKFLAITSLNGSTAAPTSPIYKDHSLLTVFAVQDRSLSIVAQAPIGKWAQGVAFSGNGSTIVAQNTMEKTLAVFLFADNKLTALPPLAIPKGGPAMIGTPRR